MTNKERFVKYACRNCIAQSEEILDRRLAIIPETSRKVVETRWGLNDGTYCHKFDTLGEMLGLDDPKKTYTEAMHDLKRAAFAEVIADREEIGDWNAVVSLGRLANCIFGYDAIYADMVCGKKLKEVLSDRLTQREKDIIFLRFGFDGKGTKLLDTVADSRGVTRERIRQIENKAIRKMRHPTLIKLFYIPEISKEEKSVQKSEIKTEATPIEELGFSVRTYNILKRANLNTIGDVLNNAQKLASANHFGKKSATEIIHVLDTTGVVNSEGKTAKDIFEEVIRQIESRFDN